MAAGAASRLEIQLSYAIGVAKPLSISLSTFGTKKVPDSVILEAIDRYFDARPMAIIKQFKLNEPSFSYADVSNYGAFGRPDLNLPWEKLDKVEVLREFFASKAK